MTTVNDPITSSPNYPNFPECLKLDPRTTGDYPDDAFRSKSLTLHNAAIDAFVNGQTGRRDETGILAVMVGIDRLISCWPYTATDDYLFAETVTSIVNHLGTLLSYECGRLERGRLSDWLVDACHRIGMDPDTETPLETT